MATLSYFPNYTGQSLSQKKLTAGLGTAYLGATLSLGMFAVQLPGISFSQFAGIDVPTLITSGEDKSQKGAILFVGESARRSQSDYNVTGGQVGRDVVIGTPFGVNLVPGAKPALGVYTSVFSHYLDEGYDVFVTDVNKVWTDQMNRTTLSKVMQSKQALMASEIVSLAKMYSKLVIVTFGSTAADFFKGSVNVGDGNPLDAMSTTWIPVLHPTTNNWSNWKAKRAADLFKRIQEGEDGNTLADEYLRDLDDIGHSVIKWIIESINHSM